MRIASKPFWGALLLTMLAGCQRSSPASAAAPNAAAVGTAAPAPATGTVVAPLATPVAVAGGADVASLVERLKPTVVNITAVSHGPTSEGPDGMFDGFPFPFMGPMPGGQSGPGGQGGPRGPGRALGTGFLVDPGGYVVTNAHVIQGADDVKVRLSDEREFVAKIVGKDSQLDLAVLHIEGATGLSAASLGDSDKLRVGEQVIAIGNPFGLGHTVTLGIASAKDRSIGAGRYDAFIQTDASINPGNSGGPLFNLRGEVVGIATAIRQGAQGIGFAVPVNALKDVLPQLRERGTVARGKLGVRFQPLNDELAQGLGLGAGTHGALVAGVEPGGAGARSGIAAGDVITSVNGTPVTHAEELPRLVARNAPGSKIKLGVIHGGKASDVTVTLDALTGDDDDVAPTRAPAAVAPRGRMGVELEDAPASVGGGARIRGVAPQSPAAGQLSPGDVIVEVDRKAIKTAGELVKKVEATPPGKVVLFLVKHGELTRYVAIKL